MFRHLGKSVEGILQTFSDVTWLSWTVFCTLIARLASCGIPVSAPETSWALVIMAVLTSSHQCSCSLFWRDHYNLLFFHELCSLVSPGLSVKHRCAFLLWLLSNGDRETCWQATFNHNNVRSVCCHWRR